MTFRGLVKNGQILLNEPVALPDGTVVSIEVVNYDEERPAIGDKLLKLAGTAAGLPPDLAENHDHYLHGTPSKK